jgi:hypothetical protein
VVNEGRKEPTNQRMLLLSLYGRNGRTPAESLAPRDVTIHPFISARKSFLFLFLIEEGCSFFFLRFDWIGLIEIQRIHRSAALRLSFSLSLIDFLI